MKERTGEEQRRGEQRRAEQSRAREEQSRAKQSGAEQSRADQSNGVTEEEWGTRATVIVILKPLRQKRHNSSV